MRRTDCRSWVLGALVLIMVAAFPGCDSPLDPISKSDRIEGLSFFEFSSTWERWDSDPQYDGILITMNYYNEYRDSLKFHDKPHNIVVEFWTQKSVGPEGNTYLVRDELVFSRTIVYSNSEDDIRIPIETYLDALKSNPTFNKAYKDRVDILGFLLVRVFPPAGYPRTELPAVGFTDQTFFKPEADEATPNP